MVKFLAVPSRLTAAFILGAISVAPMATTAFLNSKAVDGVADPSALRTKALESRVDVRKEQRLYWQAIEEYQKLLRAGEDVVKPDRNDAASIDAYINGNGIQAIVEEGTQEPDEAIHASADVVEADVQEVAATSESDRLMLRKYTRVGACPDSMKRLMPDLYRLCIAIVGKDASAELPHGIINDNVILHSANAKPAATIKLRMQMIEQANDSSRKRSSGQLPMRPTRSALDASREMAQ